MTSDLSFKIHSFLQSAKVNHKTLFIIVSQNTLHYCFSGAESLPWDVGMCKPFVSLCPFADVQPCLFVCSPVTSVKGIALPVIIATAGAKNAFIPFTAPCQKTLNTYITWQPLKDGMFTRSAFSLWRKQAVTYRLYHSYLDRKSVKLCSGLWEGKVNNLFSIAPWLQLTMVYS